MTHRGTYAARFNARGIRRPKPTVVQMTDEQFAAHLARLPTDFARTMAQCARTFGRITVYGDAATFRFNLDGIGR